MKTPEPQPSIERLVQRIREARAEDPASVEEACDAFEQLVLRGRERSAVDAALAQRRTRSPAPKLLVQAARALQRLGDPELARRSLEPLEHPGALWLLSEFASARGEHAEARRLAERVLAWDIDHPDARALVGELSPNNHDASATTTVLSSALPETSLSIVGEAGRGSAGTVYRAFDDELQRTVALKAYHQPERDRGRLLREVRLAEKLSGPGVVVVYDADVDAGWVAMEWAEGGTLEDRLRAGDVASLRPDAAWFEQLIAAIAAIHARGYVHADLKPANLLFRADGSTLISDFGLAQAVGANHAGGTVGYMSPERVAGAPAAPRDDVYSLGRIALRLADAMGAGSAGSSRLRALGDSWLSERRPPDGSSLLGELRSGNFFG